ncbi:hypothetical protein [Nocardia macrotermitis]|uniref:hypothetical protein n=1 Tax=Nocardia macrotermitis TaxID=2585198 RepID=UPI00129755C8|nr:hypothetical protein [Nocardia macrotermitis]
MVGADRFFGGQLMPAIGTVAGRQGTDIRILLDAGRRGVIPVAWRALLLELRRSGGSVIVPGPEHLDGLSVSRSSLLQQLSSLRPDVRVLYLPGSEGGMPPTELISALVGEFRVKAFATAVEVSLLKACWYLSRAGLSYLAEDVESVLRELVGSRVSTQPLDVLDEIRIRLLRTARALVLDIHESENHTAEPVSDVVRQRCSRWSRRDSATGGTLTWCELSLGDRGTIQLAGSGAWRRRTAVSPVGGGAGP